MKLLVVFLYVQRDKVNNYELVVSRYQQSCTVDTEEYLASETQPVPAKTDQPCKDRRETRK